MKIGYATVDGGTSTAYIDAGILTTLLLGSDKYTDRPVFILNMDGPYFEVAPPVGWPTPYRCTSDITLRDEDHRLVRCELEPEHKGSHEGDGATWTDGEHHG